MDTGSKTGVAHLVILSLSVGARLVASFGSPAQHGLATSAGTSNYTALEEKNKALVLEGFDTLS